MTTRASILVIEYDTAPHLPRCLEALFASELPSDHFEVIVLDNDSPTPIDPATRARFPRVRWPGGTSASRGAAPQPMPTPAAS